MTKDILLSISGLQFQADDSHEDGVPVEIITAGNYFLKNGKHYVVYDEVMEGLDGTTKNTIKIQENKVEVIKHGVTNVHLIFEENKNHISYYDTPYGNFLVGTQAQEIKVDVNKEHIGVAIEYSLEINHEMLADCNIMMEINSKKAQNLDILS